MESSRNLQNEKITKSRAKAQFGSPSKKGQNQENLKIVATAKKNHATQNDRFLKDETIKKKDRRCRSPPGGSGRPADGLQALAWSMRLKGDEDTRKKVATGRRNHNDGRESNRRAILEAFVGRIGEKRVRSDFQLSARGCGDFGFKLIKKDAPKPGKSFDFRD